MQQTKELIAWLEARVQEEKAKLAAEEKTQEPMVDVFGTQAPRWSQMVMWWNDSCPVPVSVGVVERVSLQSFCVGKDMLQFGVKLNDGICYSFYSKIFDDRSDTKVSDAISDGVRGNDNKSFTLSEFMAALQTKLANDNAAKKNRAAAEPEHKDDGTSDKMVDICGVRRRPAWQVLVARWSWRLPVRVKLTEIDAVGIVKSVRHTHTLGKNDHRLEFKVEEEDSPIEDSVHMFHSAEFKLNDTKLQDKVRRVGDPHHQNRGVSFSLSEFLIAVATSKTAQDSSSSDSDESDDGEDAPSDEMVVFSPLKQPNWKAWVDGLQAVLPVDVRTKDHASDISYEHRVVAVDLRPRDGFPDQRYLSFQVSPMRFAMGPVEYRSSYFKLADRKIDSTVEKTGDHHWSFSLFDFIQATQPKRKRAVKRPRVD